MYYNTKKGKRDLLEKRCSDEGPPNSRILPARCSGFLRGALVSGAVLLLAARCACMLAPCPLTCPGRLAPGGCQANKTHGNVAHQAFPGVGAKGLSSLSWRWRKGAWRHIHVWCSAFIQDRTAATWPVTFTGSLQIRDKQLLPEICSTLMNVRNTTNMKH